MARARLETRSGEAVGVVFEVASARHWFQRAKQRAQRTLVREHPQAGSPEAQKNAPNGRQSRVTKQTLRVAQAQMLQDIGTKADLYRVQNPALQRGPKSR